MKIISIIASRGAALLIFLALLLFLFTPYLLNSFLLPKILADNEIRGVTLQVSHLTPWSCTASITAGNAETNDISAAQIKASYTPLHLLKGQLTSVVFDGVTIRLALIDGKLSFRTLSFPTTDANDDNQAVVLPPLPLMAETLILNNCHLLIERPNQDDIVFTLHSTARLNFSKTTSNTYTLNGLDAKILSEGNLQAAIQIDLQAINDQHSLTLEATVPKLASLRALLGLPVSIRILGNAHLQARIGFSKDFSSISTINTRLTFPEFEVFSDDFSTNSTTENPLQLSIHGNTKLLDYELTNIHLSSPQKMTTFMKGTVDLLGHTVNGTGQMQVDSFLDIIALELQGSYQASGSNILLRATGKKQQFESETITLATGPYSITNEIHLSPDTTRFLHKAEIASLHIPDQELQFKSISSQLSYLLDAHNQENSAPGNFSIGQIQYKNEDLAGLSAAIQQKGDGIEFQGTLTSRKTKSLQLKLNGSLSPENPFICKLTLPASRLTQDSLPAFIALPADLAFSGEVQATADLSFNDNTPHGTLQVQLRDGSLGLEEKKISLNGISTEVNLPHLPKIFSSPQQELHINNMEIGNLKFSDGRIAFRIEDAETLFIEKSRFTWCNGKVESGSLHLSLVDPELSTTLYCDRLQFSELLSQLGISQTEGDGSLNGRLPLHFTGKEMVFDDGFLFSTPGNSGIVRFGNTEMLRQGMPEMGQAAYLDYSIQAMENFSYNWTKLTFNSTGDDLLISMQIDGKPATPLPFGYRNGQLAPQAQGSGIQHPIRLDVNFHLPFNEMFKYGQNLQKIMENMK
jgi:hypothetical protein